MNNFIIECTRCGKKIAIHESHKDNEDMNKKIIGIHPYIHYFDRDIQVDIECKCGNEAQIRFEMINRRGKNGKG